jgi:hypothetical protein
VLPANTLLNCEILPPPRNRICSGITWANMSVTAVVVSVAAVVAALLPLKRRQILLGNGLLTLQKRCMAYKRQRHVF